MYACWAPSRPCYALPSRTSRRYIIYIYGCICMYGCMYAYARIYISTNRGNPHPAGIAIGIAPYIWVHMYGYVCMLAGCNPCRATLHRTAHPAGNARIYMGVYVCMYVCMYVYVYAYACIDISTNGSRVNPTERESSLQRGGVAVCETAYLLGATPAVLRFTEPHIPQVYYLIRMVVYACMCVCVYICICMYTYFHK